MKFLSFICKLRGQHEASSASPHLEVCTICGKTRTVETFYKNGYPVNHKLGDWK